MTDEECRAVLERSGAALAHSRNREVPAALWQGPSEEPKPPLAPALPPRQQPPSPVHVSQAWRNYVSKQLDDFAAMLGTEIARIEKPIHQKIANLEQRCADLTARLAAAEALVADRAELSRRVDMLEGLTRQLIGAQLAERRGQHAAPAREPEPPQSRALSDWSTHPIGLMSPNGRLPE